MTPDEEYEAACKELVAKRNAGELTVADQFEFAKKWAHRDESCRRFMRVHGEALPERYRDRGRVW
jgi:hypothetical protein